MAKAVRRCRPKKGCKPPEGCFSVYVGTGRERFVVRTECVNHPLFRVLLEEAEEAYGYAADGPLELPCDAEAFVRVVEQIEEDRAEEAPASCGMVRGSSAYRMIIPGRPMIVVRS